MKKKLRISIIGDYNVRNASHVATNEALRHAANYISVEISITWLATDLLKNPTSDAYSELTQSDAIWCSPGGLYRSMDGALLAIRFARESGRPFIGT